MLSIKTEEEEGERILYNPVEEINSTFTRSGDIFAPKTFYLKNIIICKLFFMQMSYLFKK